MATDTCKAVVTEDAWLAALAKAWTTRGCAGEGPAAHTALAANIADQLGISTAMTAAWLSACLGAARYISAPLAASSDAIAEEAAANIACRQGFVPAFQARLQARIDELDGATSGYRSASQSVVVTGMPAHAWWNLVQAAYYLGGVESEMLSAEIDNGNLKPDGRIGTTDRYLFRKSTLDAYATGNVEPTAPSDGPALQELTGAVRELTSAELLKQFDGRFYVRACTEINRHARPQHRIRSCERGCPPCTQTASSEKAAVVTAKAIWPSYLDGHLLDGAVPEADSLQHLVDAFTARPGLKHRKRPQLQASPFGPCRKSCAVHTLAVTLSHDSLSTLNVGVPVCRPAVSASRISQLPDGMVRIELKQAWRNGATAVLIPAADLILRLAAQVLHRGGRAFDITGLLLPMRPCAPRSCQPATSRNASGTRRTAARQLSVKPRPG